MNKSIFVGRLAADPTYAVREWTAKDGKKASAAVCNFTVMVNNTRTGAAYGVRVAAWRGLADVVNKYATKGRKVMVIGEVGASGYVKADKTIGGQLELTLQEIEFLDNKPEAKPETPAPAGQTEAIDPETGEVIKVTVPAQQMAAPESELDQAIATLSAQEVDELPFS